MDEGTDIGPLIDATAIEKVQQHVEDAKAKGTQVELGGHSKGGLFFEPTILTGVTDT